MRIWLIHPKYYDRKGIQAQWNEGLILKNIVYRRKNKLTLEKLSKSRSSKVQEEANSPKSMSKAKKRNSKSSLESKNEINLNEETGEYNPKGWVNHPHSKRITRYHPHLQKYIINTYLYYLREYGVKCYNINFNIEYIDMQYVDPYLRIPIHYYQIRKDQIDVWEKMKARDQNKFDAYKSYTLPSQYTLIEPFYYEENFDSYMLYLSSDYLEWCNGDFQKLVGTEIPIDDVMNENQAANISQLMSEDDGEDSESESEPEKIQSMSTQLQYNINPLIHYELDSLWAHNSTNRKDKIAKKGSNKKI